MRFGDLAVDEVEDVGEYHDDAGDHELTDPERPGRGGVDDDAGERQYIRMNPKTHAGVDDGPERVHTDRANHAGERHERRSCAVKRRQTGRDADQMRSVIFQRQDTADVGYDLFGLSAERYNLRRGPELPQTDAAV